MKTILQLVVLVLFFFGMWTAFSYMPWNRWLHIEKLREKKEKQFSDFFIRAYSVDKSEYKNDEVSALVTGIKNRLCLANNIDTATVHIHVFKDEEINAFTIPGGNIIVNSGLIRHCDNPEMLAGVIGHEIGHIQNEHIAKRFAKEMGISVLMSFGGDNLAIIKKILGTLSSSGFDRSQEREADMSAIIFLQNARIDACPTADFFTKIDKEKETSAAVLEWIGTHPAARERAAAIRKKCKEKNAQSEPLSSDNWLMVRTTLAN